MAGGRRRPGHGPGVGGVPVSGLVPFRSGTRGFFTGAASWRTSWYAVFPGGWTSGDLLVAGESGTGKSSLLHAGLMPRLTAGALGPGSERWPRRVIRPTASPLRELAAQLADVAGADPVSVYRSLSAAPDEAPMLVELAVRTAAGRGPGTRSRRVRSDAGARRRRAWSWWLTSSRSCSPRVRTLTTTRCDGERSSRRCTRRPRARPGESGARHWWSRWCARISWGA